MSQILSLPVLVYFFYYALSPFDPCQAEVNAKVLRADAWVSEKKQRKCGSTGTVIAVSCLKDGRIRNNGDNGRRTGAPLRQFTKYYVQFEDQTILGYESHHLDLIK